MIIANKSIAVFALCTLFSDIALARNVALVIGNANYQHEGVLRNPINDARLLSQILKQDLQFDEVKLVENADFRTLNRAVEQFSAMSRGADTAVIYFSGHGQQTEDKQNYLLAVDAKIEYAADLQSSALSSDRLLTSTEGARTRLVILDACRDRPASAYKTRSGTKGLSRARDPSSTGLLVAYATEDGKVALDGTGRNSPYAEALASALKKRDQPILAMLDTVADQVERSTQYQQVPTRSGNLRTNVYLVPPRVQVAPQPQVAERIVEHDSPHAAEIAAWNRIKSSNRASDYQSFLRSYPSGLFAEAAQLKLNQLSLSTPSKPSATATPRINPRDVAQAILNHASSTSKNDQQLMSQGMWRDPKTNMIWMRCSLGQTWDGSTCTGEASKHEWQAAQDAVAAMNRSGGYGGHTDWVVPHIEDLASLIRCNTGFESTERIPAKRGGETTIQDGCNDGYQRPTIDQIIFPNTPSGSSWYWSASPDAGYYNNAWYVDFYYGGTSGYTKDNSLHVRAVRAGYEQ